MLARHCCDVANPHPAAPRCLRWSASCPAASGYECSLVTTPHHGGHPNQISFPCVRRVPGPPRHRPPACSSRRLRWLRLTARPGAQLQFPQLLEPGRSCTKCVWSTFGQASHMPTGVRPCAWPPAGASIGSSTSWLGRHKLLPLLPPSCCRVVVLGSGWGAVSLIMNLDPAAFGGKWPQAGAGRAAGAGRSRPAAHGGAAADAELS